jgi:hypothetical protein
VGEELRAQLRDERGLLEVRLTELQGWLDS